MSNPFFNRGPITEARFYFARPKETWEIMRLLAGCQACSLVGPVKSGKTSLLLHLARPATLAAHGLSSAQHTVVHLSFEGLGTLSPEQFFHLMVRELARQTVAKAAVLWPGFESRDTLSFLELEEVLDQLLTAGQRLIFLLDEVELADQNPAFDLNFFSGLRHLASRPGICFVTATERPLHEIKAAGREVGSPFADLFSMVRLRPLDPDLAWRHVSALAEEAGVDLSADRDLILGLAGGWPYYLQVVAFHAFAYGCYSQESAEDECWYVHSRAQEQLGPLLIMLWERLDATSREHALAALTEGSSAPGVDGLTIATEAGTKPANHIIGHFLEEQQRDRGARVEDYLAAVAPAPMPGFQAEPDRYEIYAVVRTLTRAVEARCRFARAHADRVTRLAVAIAKQIGCSDDVTEGIRVAARLHDIGGVSISDMILLKPGPLTELETQIIRTHPVVGVQVLEALDFPWSVKPAVRYHHERLDGSGYPEGLMGEEIPLAARVLAVADVAAAITADRPYRRARTEQEALAELRANAGSKYDPDAVAALGQVLERGLA